MSVKLQVGLEMLGETPTHSEYDAAASLLTKILANVQQNPDQEKFRTLKMSNAKVGQLLATKGARAILVGVGFVEANGMLTMPADAPLDALDTALSAIAAQAESRAQAQQAQKLDAMKQRAEMEKENEEKRKIMKLQIADDAAARQEPGWKAKAAGVKDGRAITGCSDVGIGNSGGG